MRELKALFNQLEPLKAEGLREGYRKIIEHDGHVLGMCNMYDDYEFVTWRYSSDGKSVVLGRYFIDLDNAKEDFAKRAGLVNSNRLFDEKDLKIMHSSLVNYVGLNENLDYKAEKAIGFILKKIELIVPEMLQPETEVTDAV